MSMFDKPKNFVSFLKAIGPPPDGSEAFYDHLLAHFRSGDSIGTLDAPIGVDLMDVDLNRSPEGEYEAIKSRLSTRVRGSF
jgi:hypothetical protein